MSYIHIFDGIDNDKKKVCAQQINKELAGFRYKMVEVDRKQKDKGQITTLVTAEDLETGDGFDFVFANKNKNAGNRGKTWNTMDMTNKWTLIEEFCKTRMIDQAITEEFKLMLKRNQLTSVEYDRGCSMISKMNVTVNGVDY